MDLSTIKEKIKNSYLYVVFIKRGFYGNGSILRSIFSAFLMAMVGLCLTLIIFTIKDMIFYSDFKPLNELTKNVGTIESANYNLKDDGSELFGNFTPLNPNNNLNDKNLAVNGYHALKSYDMNNDGIIDSNDEIYKHLKVWQDINGDGISQENELKTLEQANIKSLNLAFSNIDKDLDNGNNLMFEGNYTDNEGKEHKMADINFNIDTISSKHKDDITLNNEQANQINLQGSGNLRDLNQAVAQIQTVIKRCGVM